MKVLHLVPLHIPASGIVRQAIVEDRAARSAGVPWDVRVFTDVKLPPEAEALQIRTPHGKSASLKRTWFSYAADKIRHRRALYAWLRSHHAEYDVVLLRYTTSDFARAHALRSVETPVVSVHHTLELPELQLERGYQGLLRVSSERLAGPSNLRAAAAIAGVTQEIVDYELERSGRAQATLTLPNGIDTAEHKTAGDKRDQTPELLFVASAFPPWHGLDRVLSALSRSEEDCVLHVVGRVSETDLVAARADRRVKLHGHLTHEDMAHLAARAWVGLSSFALDRKGMKEASTLKVREYLAWGLPTYAGHTDRFPTDFPYYRVGAPDITAILAYAREMRSTPRESVSTRAANLISKEAILTTAYSQLQTLFS